MKYFFLLILICFLSACANPYSSYYSGTPNARTLPNYSSSNGVLQIYTTNNFEQDINLMNSKGYVVIGQASFIANSNQVTERQLRLQAEKVGASVVIISVKDAGTVTGAVPISVPSNSTSYTTGSATAYGAGGVANAYGNATTTTYGTQTMMMPYSINKSNYQAIFMAKFNYSLGVNIAALDDETRKSLQTNQGVIVKTVIEGSPAYLSDILPGDCILWINQERVVSPERFLSLIKQFEGQKISLKINRAGKEIVKNITLSNRN